MKRRVERFRSSRFFVYNANKNRNAFFVWCLFISLISFFSHHANVSCGWNKILFLSLSHSLLLFPLISLLFVLLLKMVNSPPSFFLIYSIQDNFFFSSSPFSWQGYTCMSYLAWLTIIIFRLFALALSPFFFHFYVCDQTKA